MKRKLTPVEMENNYRDGKYGKMFFKVAYDSYVNNESSRHYIPKFTVKLDAKSLINYTNNVKQYEVTAKDYKDGFYEFSVPANEPFQAHQYVDIAIWTLDRTLNDVSFGQVELTSFEGRLTSTIYFWSETVALLKERNYYSLYTYPISLVDENSIKEEFYSDGEFMRRTIEYTPAVPGSPQAPVIGFANPNESAVVYLVDDKTKSPLVNRAATITVGGRSYKVKTNAQGVALLGENVIKQSFTVTSPGYKRTSSGTVKLLAGKQPRFTVMMKK